MPAVGAHRHDGFYLRTFLGFGATRMRAADVDATVSGPGGTFGIALGGAVAENLIVYGEVFDDVAVNPDIEVGAMQGSTTDTNAGQVGFGAGIAYYVMPLNLYLSGTLSASRLQIEQNNTTVGKSDLGPGVSLMIGKEWWASPQWGLGVAGQFFGGRMKDQGTNAPTWTTAAFGIVFSATYN